MNAAKAKQGGSNNGSSSDEASASMLTQGLGWSQIVFASTMQALTWPGGVLNFDWSGNDAGQNGMAGAWATGWFPIVGNALMLGVPKLRTSLRCADQGNALLCVFGACQLAFGVTGAWKGMQSKTANGYNMAANIFGPLQNLTQFLRFNDIVSAADYAPLFIKLLIDVASDTMTAALNLGAD
jgi:hypothetical protein